MEGLALIQVLHTYTDPINIPTIKTSVPPTMTWNAAERSGIFIYSMHIVKLSFVLTG
jgi:hypothetical protein